MKNNNYTKPLLAALTLLLMSSLFFNLHDVLLAQAPNRTVKSLLTNYLGKQISFAKHEGFLKEINADHIVVEERFGNNQVGSTYVVPFEAIHVIEIGQQDYIEIKVFGL